MKTITQNTELFQNIFEAASEGILAITEDGYILTANTASEELFGYNSGEMIGENIGTLIPEKLKELYSSYVQEQNFRLNRERDVWGIKKNGSKFCVNVSLSPTIIDGQNAAIAFFWDATQQKNDLRTIRKTNVQLIESNRKFDALINNQKGIFYRCKNNSTYDVEFISEGCLETTGYGFNDYLNQTIIYGHLILEEDRKRVYKTLENAIKQKKHYSLEYRIKHKDGTIRYVWEKGAGIYNKQNGSNSIEGFITDITPQKEIELELRRSESKIKALLEANPDIMLIQDRKGVYLDWYANSPQKWFLAPKEFIGKTMKEVLPKEVYKKIKASHKQVLESGKMQVAEYSLPGKDGIEHYEARVVLMNAHSLLTIVRDVTEEWDMDALLNIQKNALVSSSDSILISDAQQPNNPIIYCNAAFEKMTGYALNEIVGKKGDFLQNDDQDQKETEIIRNAVTKAKPCKVILRNYRKDGAMFWNDLTITPVYDEENILTHFITVQNDVTNKVNEEYLKDKTRKILELIVKESPLKSVANTIIETLETHIKECVASILIFDNENNTLQKLAAPNLPNPFNNYLHDGLQVGPKFGSSGTAAFLRKEIIVTNIQTSPLWEDFKDLTIQNHLKASWSFPILSSQKKVLGTIGIYSSIARKPSEEERKVILDMTYLAGIAIENHRNTITIEENRLELEKHAQKLEQKIAERTHEVMATVQKLVETNLNLEDQIKITKLAESDAVSSKSIASEIAKNFPNGFVVVMNKDSKVIFAEGDALSQLGLKQIFQEGMTIDDVPVFSKRRKSLIKENIRKTLSGEHLSFETNFKGRYFTVNTAALLDENDEITDALHVYNDITVQKEIEFAFQNALKKEQELNELKSRFISMASHEFRTPLSAILTSTILIGKQNDSGKEQIRTKYLAQIERNVTNLTIILNDFLSLSKLDEGKVVPSPERFDLISTIKLLIKETTFAGLKNKQTINLRHSDDELFVNLDEKLLGHILNNLLSNASKYSPEGAKIDFKISQREEKVLFEITDRGIGIPKEEQQHLFGRFFRAKNAANIEGTGLGLNIVKQYIELMDGSIGFKSEINKGTTFWVLFPI